MYPALSIIFFTTTSGAGFGLLALLGLLVPFGLLPQSSWFGFVGLAIAIVLAAGGLVSSTLHLAHPERAWRALSQWRSSWLSREGVLSLLTFVPAAIFGVGWVFFGVTGGFVGLCGALSAVLGAATVTATGMIYASLKPVRQWRNVWVVPGYLALGLMGGFLILDFIIRFWESGPWGVALATLVTTLIAWWAKESYWRSIGRGSAASTPASATALGSRGRVRLLEAPHTEENYLLKEMGFHIARKHAVRLRLLARLAGFLLPIVLTLFALFAAGAAGLAAAGIALIFGALGLVIERWLFFAEAQHTVTLYYGVEAV